MGRRPAGDVARGRDPDPSFWERLEAAEAPQPLDYLKSCTLEGKLFCSEGIYTTKGSQYGTGEIF